MELRDKIIDEIKNTSNQVLVIPLNIFLESHFMTYMLSHIGNPRQQELKNIIQSIYNISETIASDSFEEYLLKEVREINSIYLQLTNTINFLQNFYHYKHQFNSHEMNDLIDKLQINLKNLEVKLQKNTPEKNELDDDIKIDHSQEHNFVQDIHTEESRVQVTDKIKTIVDEQLKTSIDEFVNLESFASVINRFKNQEAITQNSSIDPLIIMQKSYAILSIISLSSFSYFSNRALQAVLEKSHALVTLLQKIQVLEFQDESDNNSQAEEIFQIANNLLISLSGEIDLCMTYIMHEIVIKPDLLPAFSKFKDERWKFVQLNDKVDSVLKTLAEKELNVDMLVMELNEATAAVGTTSLTKIFSDQSKDLRTESVQWLWAASAMASSVIIFAGYLLMFGESPSSPTLALYEIPLRIVIIGILITATLWCGRNYRSLRHQSVVNMERADIIKTFRAFSKSADEQKVKDLVLAEGIRSVFTPSPSGFVDHSANRDSRGAINLTNSGNIDKQGGQAQ